MKQIRCVCGCLNSSHHRIGGINRDGFHAGGRGGKCLYCPNCEKFKRSPPSGYHDDRRR